ncbi:MAG: SPOR domain-containing protein [Pseudomonadota bacterium]
MAESDEALQLKRRARRRLVGAIALVTFVVIILPLILDKEPGPAGPPLDVKIPSQDSGSFNTHVVPSAPPAEKQTEISAAKAEAPADKTERALSKVEVPKAKAEGPTAEAAVASAQPADKAEEARALAALNDKTWDVSLDAFSSEKNVKQLRRKLSAAGIKSYTEPVKTSKGELTRVRAGPFPSKEAAEKARSKLVAMGLRPAAVASR